MTPAMLIEQELAAAQALQQNGLPSFHPQGTRTSSSTAASGISWNVSLALNGAKRGNLAEPLIDRHRQQRRNQQDQFGNQQYVQVIDTDDWATVPTAEEGDTSSNQHKAYRRA